MRFSPSRCLWALLCLVFFPTYAAWGSPDPIRVDMPRLPIRFEPTATPDGTAFRSVGHPGEIELTENGIRFGRDGGARLHLLEANPSKPRGEEQVEFVVSYFVGQQANWRSGVQAFHQVRYPGVYPGVDMVFHGTRGELEFDFVVSPGTDPSVIRFSLEGFDRIESGTAGDLTLGRAGDQFRLQAPVAFQDLDGNRRSVDCSFRVENGTVAFDLGAYAADVPLVIDPILQFSSYLGSGSSDSVSAIVPAADGSIYVAGWTNSISLSRGTALQAEPAGGSDVFVARLGNGGASVVWLTYLGGALNDLAADLEVDSSGNVYVVGNTSSVDFPTKDPFQAQRRSDPDVFAAKLNPSGTELIWSTYLGGTRSDTAAASMLAGQELIVAGTTASADFPVQNPIQAQLNITGAGSASDAFLARFNAAGSALVYSTYHGGAGSDQAGDLARTPAGNPVLVGTTGSTDFPTVNPLQEARSGNNDAFVTEFAANGSALVFSTYLGGTSTETGYGVTVAPDGTLWFCGDTNSSNFPLKDPIQWNLISAPEMFIAGIAPDRGSLLYSTYLGGVGSDSARDVAVDAHGRVIVVGLTSAAEFPVVGGGRLKQEASDLVVAVLDFRRNLIAFSTMIGGSGDEIPGGTAVDAQGRVFFAGVSNSLNFPSVNAAQPEYGGSGVYYSSNGAAGWVRTPFPVTAADVLHVNFQNSWVFAGTSSGLYLSENLGTTWTSIGLAGQQIRAVANDSNSPPGIYAATNTGLYKSTNKGQNWNLLCGSEAMRCELAPFTAVVVDPRNNRVVYAGTAAGGVFRSEDAGDNWLVRNGGLDDAGKAVQSLAIDPVNSANLYLGGNGRLWKTTNGGLTWTGTNFNNVGPIRGLAVNTTTPSVIYASGASAGVNFVARSGDGGNTWDATQPIQGVVTGISLVAARPDEVYAATQTSGVLKSTDRAKTWTTVNQGLPTRLVNRIAVDPRNSQRIWATSQDPSDGIMAAVQPEDVFYFPQVASGTAGRIRFQTAIVLVNTGEDAETTIEFFDSTGAPMEFDLGELGIKSRFDLELKKGGSIYAQGPGTGNLKVGYARITSGPGVDGTAIFSRTDVVANVILYEAGVPATKASGNFVFVLDSLGDKDTGIALVRAGDSAPGDDAPVDIRLALYDVDGNFIDETTVALAPGRHTARFVAELFQNVSQLASEMRGVVTVTSPTPLAALTLRQRDQANVEFPAEVASLTPFPVVQPFSYANTLYFPQVANGTFGLFTRERFQTSFILANPSQFPINFTLEFFDLDGLPMGLDIGTGAQIIRVQDTLQPRRVRFIETTGRGGFQVGYARVRAGAALIGGTAVFTQQAIDTLGRTVNLFEAGVPATVPRRSFTIFLDSLGGRDTGLAMVNTTAETAQILLKLYDLQFNLLAERTLELPAGQHLPRFISQLFPEYPPAGEMLGVVTVNANVPLAAVTLRQKNEIGIDFPQEVPLLTTFPVIPGAPE